MEGKQTGEEHRDQGWTNQTDTRQGQAREEQKKPGGTATLHDTTNIQETHNTPIKWHWNDSTTATCQPQVYFVLAKRFNQVEKGDKDEGRNGEDLAETTTGKTNTEMTVTT